MAIDHDRFGKAPLWNPSSGQFSAAALRRALIIRGWTARDFAPAAGLSAACVYNALRERSMSDRTAIRILETLAPRPPMLEGGERSAPVRNRLRAAAICQLQSRGSRPRGARAS